MTGGVDDDDLVGVRNVPPPLLLLEKELLFFRFKRDFTIVEMSVKRVERFSLEREKWALHCLVKVCPTTDKDADTLRLFPRTDG